MAVQAYIDESYTDGQTYVLLAIWPGRTIGQDFLPNGSTCFPWLISARVTSGASK